MDRTSYDAGPRHPLAEPKYLQRPKNTRIRIFPNLRRMKLTPGIFFFLLLSFGLRGQQQYHVACVAFYNFENLFDTLDSPDTDDHEFLPDGPNLYTSEVYADKLGKLAKVVSEIGTEYTPDGAAILGVCEVENLLVLEDFVRQPLVAARNYQIIHQDSRDRRGVDVALLYNPKYFTPDKTFFFPLPVNTSDSSIIYSRDILWTSGQLLGERVLISVNHWPSRSGGEERTAPLRNLAAQVNRRFLDSLLTHHTIDKHIVMGDLNDDPTNESVRDYLRASRKIENVDSLGMYNPFEDFYRKGLGTTAYRDAWSLFDQIILSHSLARITSGLRYYKAGIHNPSYMTQKTGVFKGYPLRTYANGNYAGGYSDHFPVYVLLVKEKA